MNKSAHKRLQSKDNDIQHRLTHRNIYCVSALNIRRMDMTNKKFTCKSGIIQWLNSEAEE